MTARTYVDLLWGKLKKRDQQLATWPGKLKKQFLHSPQVLSSLFSKWIKSGNLAFKGLQTTNLFHDNMLCGLYSVGYGGGTLLSKSLWSRHREGLSHLYSADMDNE
ncbi:hypothetical protein AMELA_G00146440 [Ameiurus melas]|uniref:Uncharacterized protein n=1 Tax=Ameiurus melas TaxID=219545 RepID=A0A7J6AGB9_AMEME|nr:hypothetical protein AMELA_G00146440 [Ameiurus melas]